MRGTHTERGVTEGVVIRFLFLVQDLEKCLEDRRAVVLAVNVSSSWFADSDAKRKVEKLNREWESLQQKSADWTKSLQESLAHSQVDASKYSSGFFLSSLRQNLLLKLLDYS